MIVGRGEEKSAASERHEFSNAGRGRQTLPITKNGQKVCKRSWKGLSWEKRPTYTKSKGKVLRGRAKN